MWIGTDAAIARFQSESAMVWGHVRGTYGELTIIDPDAKCSFLTNTSKYARVSAGFRLRIVGGNLDFRGTPTGTSARVALWDKEAAPGSMVEIEGTKIENSAISSVAAVFDLAGNIGTAIARRVTSSLRTGFPEGHTGAPAPAIVNTTINRTTLVVTSGALIVGMPIIGENIPGGARVVTVSADGLTATMSANASSTKVGVSVTQSRVFVDLTTTDYGATQPGTLTLEITAANGYAADWRLLLDLQGRGQQFVRVNIRTDLPGGAITGIVAGAFAGQQVLIRNVGTSVQPFALWRAPGARLNLAANLSLAPYQRLALDYDGSVFLEA